MTNGYFHKSDPAVLTVAGRELHQEWWSRPYEYAWALEQAHGMKRIADMGCGWMGRPLRDGLVLTCDYVYAVDADPRLLQLANLYPERMALVVGDFTRGPMMTIGQAELDGIFCVSVLEDLRPEKLTVALETFEYHLKSGGRIAVTFDVLTDKQVVYPGLEVEAFEIAMRDAGLWYIGDVDYSQRDDLLRHNEWNLCCFHALIGRAE